MPVRIFIYCSLPNCTADIPKLETNNDSTALGLPYDFGSMMQLRYDVYSKNGLPTIMPKNDDNIPIAMSGGSSWPSKQDYLDLNLYYCGEMIELKHKTFAL